MIGGNFPTLSQGIRKNGAAAMIGGKFLPSLRDSGILDAYPGLTPWANVCWPSGPRPWYSDVVADGEQVMRSHLPRRGDLRRCNVRCRDLRRCPKQRPSRPTAEKHPWDYPPQTQSQG